MSLQLQTEQQSAFAELYARAAQVASEDFLSFCKYMKPNFTEGKHHKLIAEHLEAVEAKEIKRLMIFMPPRSGKSLMTSELFPAWYIGRNPHKQILSISHSIDLAENFGREVKQMVNSPEFSMAFPGCELSETARAAVRWHTKQGGRYHAAGSTANIAGKGASLGIIDDPIGEQDAWSKAERDRVIRWYPGGFRSRLMPEGQIVLTMTRWHEDDLAGWLIKSSKDDWTILKIPALLDNESAKMIGYAPGTTYWPPHPSPPAQAELIGWSTEYLEQTRDELPPYQWQALYMQEPSVEGGNIIKRDDWQSWTEDDHPPCDYVFQTIDTAFSEKAKADYSAITTWGVFDRGDSENKHIILLGAEKGRWPYPDLKRKVIETLEYHEPDLILIEKKASGQSLLQDLRISGLPVLDWTPDKDKISRAHASTPMFANKRVWAPTRKGFAEDVINECAAFPRGNHDDYVDCVTMAVNYVRQGFFVTNFDEDAEFKEERQWKSKKKRRLY